MKLNVTFTEKMQKYKHTHEANYKTLLFQLYNIYANFVCGDSAANFQLSSN